MVDVRIDSYHKGGYVCTLASPLKNINWSDAVLESLELVLQVGRSWVLTGDITSEFDAWSNESSIAGIQSIYVFVDANGWAS